MDHPFDLDEFNIEIVKNGYDLQDFDLNYSSSTNWYSTEIVKVKGTVTVVRKSNQKQKTYRTGKSRHWIEEFIDDLKFGFFN